MPAAARLNDSVAGTTSGEHNGHSPAHGPLAFSGEISGGCSTNVFINGRPGAVVDSQTVERDSCCGSSSGAVAVGSATVLINGQAAARLGDALAAHNGSGTITGGSPDVFVG